jgi:repressor LexA
MLTAKQRELLIFIKQRLGETGISPSFDEMREALDLKSKSGVHRLISALEERGFIRRLPNRARALEVLKMPRPRPRGRRHPAQAGPARARQRHDRPSASWTYCGWHADRGAPGHRNLPGPRRSARARRTLCARVFGDSMVEEGILDGDFALIRKADTAREGEIVVALVNQEEATLKTFRREGNMIRLDPANRHYEPQRYREDQVQIQGRLAGLIRRY